MTPTEARNAARYAGAKAEGMLDIGELTEAKERYQAAIEAIESVETEDD